MDSPIAMGIDVSLTRTGVAYVGLDDDQAKVVETSHHGRAGKRNEPLMQRLERLRSIVDGVAESILEHAEWPQVALIEDVPFGTPGGSTTDRAALWWMLVDMLTRREIPVIAANVSKVKIYATGRGNKHEKDEVMLSIVRRYPDAPIENNDEADATVLAMMGVRLLGQPYEVSMPQTHLRAMDGLAMP